MSDTTRFTFHADGAVTRPGVETGKMRLLTRRDPDLEHPMDGDAVAIHVDGHSYWTGIGIPRGYAPACVEVWQFSKSLPDGGRWLLILTWRTR
jgi:hypothetical protein